MILHVINKHPSYILLKIKNQILNVLEIYVLNVYMYINSWLSATIFLVFAININISTNSSI